MFNILFISSILNILSSFCVCVFSAGTQIHPRQAKYNVTDESPPMDLDSNESSPNLDNCSAEVCNHMTYNLSLHVNGLIL